MNNTCLALLYKITQGKKIKAILFIQDSLYAYEVFDH